MKNKNTIGALLLICFLILAVLQLGCSTSRSSIKSQQSADCGRSTAPGICSDKASIAREISRIRKKVRKTPNDPFLHEQLSSLLEVTGDSKSAMCEIEKAIKLAPNDPGYYSSQAFLLMRNKRPSEALNSFQRAAALVKNSNKEKEWAPIYSFESARLYEQLGNKQAAESWYEDALSMLYAYRPEWIASGMDKRNQTGDFGQEIERESIEHLEHLQSILAKNRPTKLWIAKDMPFLQIGGDDRSPGMSSEERASLEKRLKMGILGGEEPHLRLGMDYIALGREEQAVIHLLAARELAPKEAIVCDELGWTYMLQGRLFEASAAMKQAAQLGSASSINLAQKLDEAAVRFCRASKTSSIKTD